MGTGTALGRPLNAPLLESCLVIKTKTRGVLRAGCCVICVFGMFCVSRVAFCGLRAWCMWWVVCGDYVACVVYVACDAFAICPKKLAVGPGPALIRIPWPPQLLRTCLLPGNPPFDTNCR